MCAKLGKLLPGLEYAPLKGELGRRIFHHVSRDAWSQWISHSTMIINEFRLNPSEPESQRILSEQAEKFLFGGGAAPPEGYVAPGEGGAP